MEISIRWKSLYSGIKIAFIGETLYTYVYLSGKITRLYKLNRMILD